MRLSHKDLVKFGRYEAGKGYSLSQIEADFLKKGIKRKDAIRALDEIEYYKKRESLKARQEAENSEKAKVKAGASGKQSNAENIANEKKSKFWPWFILILLAGITLYLYFSGAINFDWLHSITFK